MLGNHEFGPWGNNDRTDSVRTIHRALDAGVNFVDTAEVYGAGVSEEIVDQTLRGRRDDVVLATKFFQPRGDDPNSAGDSGRWVIKSVDHSLRRVNTDHIDLYKVHRPRPTNGRQGNIECPHRPGSTRKVRYIGPSTYTGSEIVEDQS